MHDPKLLAVLDRREPVTFVDRFNIRDNHWSELHLAQNLAFQGFRIGVGWNGGDYSWDAYLVWNLTIAALLDTSARRAMRTHELEGFECR